MAKPQEKVSFRERLKQIGQVFAFTAKQDKWFVPLLVAAVLIPFALTAVTVLLGFGYVWVPIGVMVALLAALIVLNLRSNAAMMNAAEGQPGAAASIMENMRGDWRVRAAASSTTQFDMVHIVIGRPGVILVGEGSPNRLASLLAAEKKRVARVAYEVPIFEFQVGNGEGQVPVSKLQRKIMRLPRQLKPAAVSDINHRLKALQPSLQAPKGPIPRNIRQPKMPRPKAR